VLFSYGIQWLQPPSLFLVVEYFNFFVDEANFYGDILICFLTTFLCEQGEEEDGVEASPSEPPTEPRRVARPGEPCKVQTEAFLKEGKTENPRTLNFTKISSLLGVSFRDV
jgi:hypothetical protein